MKTLPSLFRVAIQVLAVPSSSAPVERVFSHGEDRLILEKGNNPCEGLLKVYHADKWGFVGCQGWSQEADQVVCRSTNCGERVNGSEETAQERVDPVLLNNLECKGTEQHLWKCPNPGWGILDIHKGTVRKVQCSSQIKIDLDGFRCEGIVRFSRDNGNTFTGVICRDGFKKEEADHLCESLGCGTSKEVTTRKAEGVSERIKINCPDPAKKKIDNLWQCSPTVSEESTCSQPAAVTCTRHERLQLTGDPSNVCAGKLEIEEGDVWKPAINISSSPDEWCEQMNCGTKKNHSQSATNLKCPDQVKVVLMKNNKPSYCYGEVHIQKNGGSKAVCATGWEKKDAEIVCKELKCGSVISTEARRSSAAGIMDNVKCSGSESSLWHCRGSHGDVSCRNVAYVVCEKSAEVKLVDGPERCAGRVEIKYDGEWRWINRNTWIGDENSDVVCELLKCGKKRDNGEKFSKGSVRAFLDRNVQCSKGAKHISKCIAENKLTNNPSGDDAVGITCEKHKMLFLQGEGACSGMVGIEQGAKTSWLSGSTAWTQDTANAVCRQKHCGEADTFTSIPNNLTGDVWTESYSCPSTATSLFDCKQGTKPDQNDTIATVECKGTINVSLSNTCWGTVKACIDGKCGGVCAETWTPERSKQLCKNWDCGENILKPFSKPANHPVTVKSLHSTKNINNLDRCSFIKYDGNDNTCNNNPAYVVCSGSVECRFEPSRDKCSGNVQVYYEGKWLPVCKNALDAQTQKTICEELQCGEPVKTIEHFGPKSQPVISQIVCSEKDKSLRTCTITADSGTCDLGGLQCSKWTKMEVTQGAACSGALHILSKEKKTAVSYEGFTENEGDKICGNLNCGKFQPGNNPSSSQAPEKTSFNCSKTPKNIWECDSETSSSSEMQTVYIKCQDEPQVTLSNHDQCHGEVKINGVEVCATGWKEEYSTKVCQELQCITAIPGLISGKEAVTGKKYHHVSCEENHHVLGQCKRFEEKCSGQLVSVYCVRNIKFNTTEHCGGQIEINYRDRWEKVCPPALFPSNLKTELCKKLIDKNGMACGGHNSSMKDSTKSDSVDISTTLTCTNKHNDIKYCVEHKSCAKSKPAEIYCNGYVAPVVKPPPVAGPPLVPILLGVVFLLVLVIVIVLFIRFYIVKKGKKVFNTSSRMFSRHEEEFGSGEFEDIKENEMEDLTRSRFRSDAEVVMETDARSTSSYDDIDEAQALTPQNATPVSENNYINEGVLDRNTDGVTYEVEDPQENYDDIEASPELTQTEAEVHHSPQTAPESNAAVPFGLVLGEDDYLVPGQDG
ncbi:scavenger receptor cysteine-rich type 1 protein M160-like [Centropristis striata]|uniref:scavenger receptor cysteine-rich type 1 protein M160-like n=1 Tax=Centropristis striata TaxID=184440 RepID=UPI0027E117EB|nr:scavenger receptor cysteine-rich type 1 protein M160-like [Centropristis striata]